MGDQGPGVRSQQRRVKAAPEATRAAANVAREAATGLGATRGGRPIAGTGTAVGESRAGRGLARSRAQRNTNIQARATRAVNAAGRRKPRRKAKS